MRAGRGRLTIPSAAITPVKQKLMAAKAKTVLFCVRKSATVAEISLWCTETAVGAKQRNRLALAVDRKSAIREVTDSDNIGSALVRSRAYF